MDPFVLLELIKGSSCILIVPNTEKNKEDARTCAMVPQIVFEIANDVCQLFDWLGFSLLKIGKH